MNHQRLTNHHQKSHISRHPHSFYKTPKIKNLRYEIPLARRQYFSKTYKTNTGMRNTQLGRSIHLTSPPCIPSINETNVSCALFNPLPSSPYITSLITRVYSFPPHSLTFVSKSQSCNQNHVSDSHSRSDLCLSF